MSLLRPLRRLWYRMVPTYQRIELRKMSEQDADRLIRMTDALYPPEERWRIARENDAIIGFGLPVVIIERRRRITE